MTQMRAFNPTRSKHRAQIFRRLCKTGLVSITTAPGRIHQMLLFLLLGFLLVAIGAAYAYGEPIKIMPLGDSITYDNNADESRIEELRTGYRQPLWIDLMDAGYDIDFVGSLKAGQYAVPPFDPDNEGHSGWSDSEIAADVYNFLYDNTPDMVLLHIGTNDLDASPDGVEAILNEIDLFEIDFETRITVVLALIINRNTYSSLTSLFNDNLFEMAQNRIDNGDDIYVVDMEIGAGIDYRLYPIGDMIDNLHPADTGYRKMANVWFDALADILPPPAYYPPEIISTPPLTAYVGASYQYNLLAKGNPGPAYYLQSGPVGVDVDLLSGKFTWVPALTGNVSMIVEAVNSEGVDMQTFTVNVAKKDKIWIEAESGDLAAPMEAGQDADASAGAFVWTQYGTGGHATYGFEVLEPGNYRVWGRIIAATSGSNSFFVAMDSGTEQIWDLQQTSTWLWDLVSARGGSDPSIFYLDAGYHTFRISQRETGARVDRILITTDTTYVPSGPGETGSDPVHPALNLTIGVSGSGSVTKGPDLPGYAEGQVVTLTATPSDGWQFDGWSGDLVGSVNPESITLDTSKTVTANFSLIEPPPEPQPDKIWLEAESGDIVVPMVAGQDTAASGGGFVWSQNGTGGYVDYLFEVTEPGDYVVWGRVIAESSGSNSFFVSMDDSVEQTWDLTQSATWLWDPVSARGGSDPSVFYLNAGYHTLRIAQRETGARVDRILITTDTTYVPSGPGETGSDPVHPALNLTIGVSGSGSVTKGPDLPGYAEGQVVTLTATPSDGWQFDGWSGDLVGSVNPESITLDTSKTVTANFSLIEPPPEPQPDKIWLEAESGDIVVPMVAGQDTAASGGGFVWSQNGAGGYVDYLFEVTEPGDYVVWGRVIAESSGSNSFFVAMDSGTEQIWDLQQTSTWLWDLVSARGGSDPSIFYLDAGYHTFRISQRETGARVDRILITTDTTYVPSGPGETGSDPVHPALNLTIGVSGSGSVTKGPDLPGYAEGQVVTLTATPSDGWQFDGWSGDLVGSVNPESITLDTSKTVTANFSLIEPPSEPQPDKIWLEAESGDIVVPMVAGQDTAASGGGFVWSQNGTGGYVDYLFEVTEPGDYVVWGRVIAESSGSNSFFVSMDDSVEQTWDLTQSAAWLWDPVSARGGSDPSVFYLNAGYHTLRIAQRETGARVDRILITSDLNYQP